MTSPATHLCPFVREVDHGTVRVSWHTSGQTVELHQLAVLIDACSSTEISHEQWTVADAEATLARSAPWLPVIRALGYPAALVAQDGLQDLTVPWDDFDVLLVGGSTTWKLSPHAARIATEAKRRGKRVHMGRVNSGRRWGIAELFECDSVDGTFLAFGPDVNLGRLLSWMDAPTLFSGEAS